MNSKIYKILISVIVIIIIIANSLSSLALSIMPLLSSNGDISLLSEEKTINVYANLTGYAIRDNNDFIMKIFKMDDYNGTPEYYNLLCVNHGKSIWQDKLSIGSSLYTNEDAQKSIFKENEANKGLWLLDNLYLAENVDETTKDAMRDNLKKIMKSNTTYSESDIDKLINDLCINCPKQEGNPVDNGTYKDPYYAIFSIAQLLLWHYTNNEVEGPHATIIPDLDGTYKLYKATSNNHINENEYPEEVAGNYQWLYDTLKQVAETKGNYSSPNINENGMKSELEKVNLTNGVVDLNTNRATFMIENNSSLDFATKIKYEVQIDNQTIEDSKYNINQESNKITINFNDTDLNGKNIKLIMKMTGISTNGYYVPNSDEQRQNLISVEKSAFEVTKEGTAKSEISGSYNMNIVKKSILDDSELSDKTKALGDATFKVTKKVYGGQPEDVTVETKEGQDSKSIFGNVEINKDGIGEDKPDIYTIEEVNVPSGFQKIDLSDISISVYKKQVGEKYIIDYVKVDKAGTEQGTAKSGEDNKNGESKIDLDKDNKYDLGLEVSNDGTSFSLTIRNTLKEGKYNVKLIKTDSKGNALTEEETRFKINGTEIETVKGQLEIAKDKQITTNGQKDEYSIEETVPPKGYDLYKGKINLTVVGKEDTSGYEVDDVNTKLTVNGEELSQNAESKDGYVTWSKTGNTITIKVKNEYADLALRKFITKVDDKEITDREPDVDLANLIDKTSTTATYTHPKDPILVAQNQIITYTIRIYNEGTMDAYASLIKDDIPEGLEFVRYTKGDGSINDKYRWKLVDENDNEVTDISKAKYVVTDYLAKDTEEKNLLKGFDKNTMTELDFRDVQVQFKVTEPNTSDRILINQAQIAEETDKNGDKVTDRDSTPNEWKGEDDEDIEKVRVLYFDLALRKWVTQAIVTENGQTYVTETGHKAEDDPEEIVKVDLKKSKLNNVTVKFKYSIRITNEGEIAGEAQEISDYIPNGLMFIAEDNPDWREEEGKVVTDKLAGTTLNPGESAEVEIILTWINSESNMGVMTNTAEISKDHNEYGAPDIDSTPNNKVPGEDDIDDAPVMLTITTGTQIIMIVTLGLGVITIIGIGIILIKKKLLI